MRPTSFALLLFVPLLFGAGLARADQTTATVQQALKDQGFYYGEVAGQKNADTTAAIRRYQIRNGLQITGAIDAETLRSLGVGAGSRQRAPQPQATVAPPAENPPEEDDSAGQSAEIAPENEASPPVPARPRGGYYAPPPSQPGPSFRSVFYGTPYEMAPPDVQRHVIVGAQRLLARAGFYRSGIDGVFGPGTASAVRAFQSRAGILPNGRLNMETLGALGLLPGQPPAHLLRRRVLLPRPVYRGQWIPN